MKKLFGILVAVLVLFVPMTVSAEQQQKENWWGTVTLELFATPYTGVALDFSDTTFIDPGISASLAYFPWSLSPTINLGFMGKMNLHLAIGLQGVDHNTFYTDSQNTFIGWWYAFSPMEVLRFQVDENSHINLGLGFSFWAYPNLALPVSHPPFSVNESGGISFPSIYVSFDDDGAIIELGTTGPDFYVGFGASF